MGYTHGWSDALSSSTWYGYLRISPSADMPLDRDLPKSTRCGSLNLAWHICQRDMLGIKYLWGQNITLADTRGQGRRMQTALRYNLSLCFSHPMCCAATSPAILWTRSLLIRPEKYRSMLMGCVVTLRKNAQIHAFVGRDLCHSLIASDCP